jgi:hypothetical protein
LELERDSIPASGARAMTRRTGARRHSVMRFREDRLAWQSGFSDDGRRVAGRAARRLPSRGQQKPRVFRPPTPESADDESACVFGPSGIELDRHCVPTSVLRFLENIPACQSSGYGGNQTVPFGTGSLLGTRYSGMGSGSEANRRAVVVPSAAGRSATRPVQSETSRAVAAAGHYQSGVSRPCSS